MSLFAHRILSSSFPKTANSVVWQYNVTIEATPKSMVLSKYEYGSGDKTLYYGHTPLTCLGEQLYYQAKRDLNNRMGELLRDYQAPKWIGESWD